MADVVAWGGDAMKEKFSLVIIGICTFAIMSPTIEPLAAIVEMLFAFVFCVQFAKANINEAST